ncbi:MAG TPA: sigma 54-interacting transcriptional regulator [Myxococcales bacterium]|nr:sigma 54-interacting transcriptional regulator [Myxococcales bacterium]
MRLAHATLFSATNGAGGIIHQPDSPLAGVLRSCDRIASSDATVLLTGETGTGKEVFARHIHQHSRRAARAFVPVNCGAIPEALLESELFGHVRGAFTGAATTRRGRLALADGGTLFLDEIGELPLSLQVKLLRVLQERRYEPIGASESVPSDFRLLAATNRDLAAEVEAGRFRRDLYYRLLVCPLQLPSLRERRSDIAPLFLHFWAARGESRPVEPQVLEALAAYAWPGNVRELENLVERLSVCTDAPSLRVVDLPVEMRRGSLRAVEAAPAGAPAAAPVPPPAPAPAPVAPVSQPEDAAPEALLAAGDGQLVSLEIAFPVDLPTLLRVIEDRHIDAALARAGGNRKAAADLLGLQRTTLVEKLRRREREAPRPAPEP